MKVGIVLGYGLFDKQNGEYKDYLDWIVSQSEELGIEKLILCGGFTNHTKPQVSEAKSMSDYIKTKTENLELILEEQSLTTPQNLEYASGKITPEDDLFVFGDLIRMAKIVWLSMHYLLKMKRSEIAQAIFEYSRERKIRPFAYKRLTMMAFDFPSRTKEHAIGQSFSTLLEVESIYNSELEEEIVTQRKKDFELN